MKKREKRQKLARKVSNYIFVYLRVSYSPRLLFSPQILPAIFFILICTTFVQAQRIAFLTPDNSETSQNFRTNLETILSKNFQVLDDSLAASVSQNLSEQNLFNLATEDAQNFGQALGANFFVLVKSETLRRSIEEKPKFYIESYAVVYLVSTRTGRLVFWKLESFQAPTNAEAEKMLAASVENLAQKISENIEQTLVKERAEVSRADYEELPEENSADAKNFRSPLPYRRLKPEYTKIANLYGITATVDAAVELDAEGNIKNVEITRWAGYELDESVEAVIRKMQWRAATRNGKSLPIRVLLRYNFKKIERD
jgi:TonB family protein